MLYHVLIPEAQSPSIAMSSTPFTLLAPPFPSGNHRSVVCIYDLILFVHLLLF